VVLIMVCTTLLIACSKVPITGRKQLNLLPESELTGMSLTNYRQFLQENEVVKTGSSAAMVNKVGNNIANAVMQYLRQSGQDSRINDFKWEFNLIKDETVNAWCMPGGKVAVYEGIIPVAKDETGLAVVMGHEIAHAVARHGNERMSQGLLQQLGAVGLAVALQNKPQETQGLFQMAYGLGTALGGILPFSRKHESEADELGLIFMAMAGYNPSEAPAFWQRMSTAGNGQPPQFLSTHPSHQNRIAHLQELIPTAMQYYTGNSNANTPLARTPSTPRNSNNTARTSTAPSKRNTQTIAPKSPTSKKGQVRQYKKPNN